MREVKSGPCISAATFSAIHEHVDYARQKHPWPKGYSDAQRYRAAADELHEVAEALLKGNKRAARLEWLDLIAVAVRAIEGD